MILRLNEEDKEFLHTMWKTVLPHEYHELSERTYKQAFAYFISILLLGFFVMAVLFLPQLIVLPSLVENSTAKFSEISIDLKVQTTEPVIFTGTTPLLIIDTTGNITSTSRAKMLVTQDYIEYGSLTGTKRLDIASLQTLGKNPEFLTNALLYGLLILGPGLFIAGFLLAFIKYFIAASLIGILGFLFTRLLRFHVEFKNAYVTSFYASSLMVLIDYVTYPIGLDAYLLPTRILGASINIISFAVYLTLFIIAIFLTGHLEMRY